MFKPVDANPDFNKIEEEVLKFWEKEKIFEKSLEQTRSGEPFTFYDGPPFATGLPHYGHILASTIKDLVPRYQTMKGRYVARRWGWDCHGLPIEEIVERKLKISGKKEIEKIGIKKFNETCRGMVLRFADEWGKMVRRMGRWVEFENSYKTMDREYMESVWWAFKQIYERGLVYEGRKVLLYCPRCETPVSNFEVAMDNSYKDVTEEAVIAKFQITNSKLQTNPKIQIPNDKPTYLLAWTTTPWTLVGNVALAVGTDIDYVVVEKDGENYIIAKDRRDLLFNSPPHEEGKGEVIKGKDLVGLEYEPLYKVEGIVGGKSHRVYAGDEFVNTEEGTGIVHTAVVYGEEDYALGLREGLPVVPLLDEKGVFNEKSPPLVRGKYFKAAEKLVKEDLDSRGLMFEKKMHEHSYPHCWRCDTVLFYNAIPAWFINIQKIKAGLLKSNKKEINWFPEHLKTGRYHKSVEAAPDWNISRNRYWGNPIPIWRCGKCGKNKVVGTIAELEKVATTSPQSPPHEGGKEGGSWNSFDLHRPYIDEVALQCDECGGEARRIPEIFDSWFEAASMPFAQAHWPFAQIQKSKFKNQNYGDLSEVNLKDLLKQLPFPAQFVAEYIAQTRAWFYVMHAVSYVLFDKAPFENVVTTGTILASDGSKMSKSKNNFPDPWNVIEKHGVDTLRFYLMNSAVMDADNLNFSEKDLSVVNRKVFRILWNVYNYFVSYANATSPLSPPHEEGKGEVIDRWILARLQGLVNDVTDRLDNYDTVRATREIAAFIDDLSTWYLRRSRGRQDSAFFQTMHESLVTLAKLLAPFAPFMAEEIYQNIKNQKSKIKNIESVHLEKWPEAEKLTKEQENLLSQMAEVRKIAEEAHALRAKAGIKLRQPLAKLTIPIVTLESRQGRGDRASDSIGPSGLQNDNSLLGLLKSEVNVKEIVYGDPSTGSGLELDATITPELKLEGLTRELERQIQILRKEQGLKIGEMAEMEYGTDASTLINALEKVDLKKVYLSKISNFKGQMSNIGKEIEVEGGKIYLKIKLQ